MPVWFSFAVVASILVAMGSGSRAGFRTQAEIAEEERKRLAEAKVQGRWA